MKDGRWAAASGKWVTNSPAHAEALRAADNRYQAAREAAKRLPLDKKATAFKVATARWKADYTLIAAGAFDRVLEP
jgi:ferric-dicitrate binding protein FerR (iron transport regulator)